MNLEAILTKVIPGLGYEFVTVEVTPAKLIRVIIDKEGGITIYDCEMVSNHLSKLFLVEEIDYNRLEVSSPGLERPLKKLEDFIRFNGKLAKVKTRELIEEQKVFQGIIKEINGEMISLQIENKVVQIDFSNISRARLVFEYKSNLKLKKHISNNKKGTK